MTREAYAAYRQTAPWLDRVAQLHLWAGGRCQGTRTVHAGTHHAYEKRCTETTQLQAHHHTYARLGHEAPGDLILLCVRCHIMAHLLGAECHCCGEAILDDDEAWDIVNDLPEADLAADDAFQTAFEEASYNWHWPYCTSCEHMTNKD